MSCWRIGHDKQPLTSLCPQDQPGGYQCRRATAMEYELHKGLSVRFGCNYTQAS
jgi:hypothetical protein